MGGPPEVFTCLVIGSNRMHGHACDAGAVGVVLPEGAGERCGGCFDAEEPLHAAEGIVGLALVHSEEPRGAIVLGCQWLEELQSGVVRHFDAEVVGKTGDEAGEELKFFVGGGLLLRCFERVEGRQKT